VGDATLNAIDRFFDIVDSGVEKIDHAFNRGKEIEDKQHSRRRQRGEVIIDAKLAQEKKASAAPAQESAKKAAPASTSSLARKPHFYIVESASPTGLLFVVTDGGKARTECSTREFAEKILRALKEAS
jgi:hypothetical protein